MAKTKFTPKRTLRASGAALLLACLLALVLGVFGAVYFQQNQQSTPQIASNTPPPPPVPMVSAPPEATTRPPAPTQAPENSQASQAVPSPESQAAQTPPQTAAAAPAAPAAPPEQAPATPSPEPPPSVVQSLAQISPSAAPANVAAAAPRYWVEFGAYDASFYADRLKQSLGKLGIAATMSEVPGKHGRRYLRVRGADQSDRTTALAQRDEAHRALRIRPLLHRVAAVSPGAARVAHKPAGGTHWVQFGAFHSRRSAEGEVAQLRKNNVQATVVKAKHDGKETLYLVRVSDLPNHAAAAQVAQHGTTALHSSDVLIGENLHAASLNARAPPR